MGNRVSHKAYWLLAILGSLAILVSRAVGSVAPDIEKIFNGFHRGAWHLYQADNLLYIASPLIQFSIILLLVWVVVTSLR